MIWLKVKIPIPKLVVTIYRLSFLWPLKRTVHFFYRSDNFAVRLIRLRVSAFGFHKLLLY